MNGRMSVLGLGSKNSSNFQMRLYACELVKCSGFDRKTHSKEGPGRWSHYKVKGILITKTLLEGEVP